MKNIFVFLMGAAIGSVATYLISKKRLEAKYEVEIQNEFEAYKGFVRDTILIKPDIESHNAEIARLAINEFIDEHELNIPHIEEYDVDKEQAKDIFEYSAHASINKNKTEDTNVDLKSHAKTDYAAPYRVKASESSGITVNPQNCDKPKNEIKIISESEINNYDYPLEHYEYSCAFDTVRDDDGNTIDGDDLFGEAVLEDIDNSIPGDIIYILNTIDEKIYEIEVI